MALTFGSLFSCIGLMDKGLEDAGMECRWQVEIDDYRRKVLAKHWPGVPRYMDVREQGGNLERVDLICGGPPCEPISYAGRGLGDADPRWLWPEAFRIIGHLRPRYVLLENPAAILRRGMGYIVGSLAALGYDAEWDCLPAAAFGAPHLRDRVFIVAYPAGERLQGPRYLGQDAGDSPTRRDWETSDALDALLGGAMSVLCRDHDRRARGLDRSRLAGLGEAVVPQVAEWIGRRIMEVDRWTK